MKKVAVDKASQRLERARQALQEASASTNHSDFESAWSDFLIALNTIMTVLEKGAHGHATSRQWFGGKKEWIRKDPLLGYLIQARNVDEHGLAPVAAEEPPSLALKATSKNLFVKSFKIGSGGAITNLDMTDTGGGVPYIQLMPSYPVLVSVTDDRFGTSFHPPTQHLGQPLTDETPIGCAMTALAFYAELIEEARSRAD